MGTLIRHVIIYLLVCVVPPANPQAQDDERELTLISFLPITGNIWPRGLAIVPALEMAAREVNRRTDILPGYTVNLVWRDSQCEPGYSTDALYESLYAPPVKHMVVGPVCSPEAESQAQAARYWNISHLSFAAASPNLSNRRRFPRFFRISPSDTRSNLARLALFRKFNNLSFAAASPNLSNRRRFPRFFRISPSDTRSNLARLALFRKFNWRKVATINIASDFFSAVTDNLVQLLKETDINIITQEIFQTDPTRRIHNLKAKDARIILAGSYESTARKMICEAYRIGMYGSKIVWMFPGWFNDHWWRYRDVPCSLEEMDTAAEGHFLTGVYMRNPKEEQSVGGITPAEFDSLIAQEPTYTAETMTYGRLNPGAYDAVWGCALALNCTHNAMVERGYNKTLDEFQYSDGDLMTSCLKNLSYPGLTGHIHFGSAGEPLKNIRIVQIQGYNKTLDEFQYSDGDIGDLMTSCLKNLSYPGLTGHIHFDSAGEPLKNIRIVQIQDSVKVTVGTYVLETDDWYIDWHNGGIRWPGGVAPRDSTQVTMVEKSLSVPLFAVMCLLATLGNALAAGLLVFNIIYRKHVNVKLSSPVINNVLLAGCMLCYSTIYMYGLHETSSILCKLRHFTFAIGFTAAFGAMFSKTWRVYKIFCNKHLQQVKINDLQLLTLVVALVTVMLVILIVWQIVDPLTIVTLNLDKETYMTGNDAIAIPFVQECTSSKYYYFMWTICIVEGALLAFGAFLSFETRKVRIEALNDSRQIGMCLYNVILFSSLVLILSLLLDHQVALMYGIFSGFVILGTSATLLMIFIPKIQSVFYPQSVAPNTSQLNSQLSSMSGSGAPKPTPNVSTVQTMASG